MPKLQLTCSLCYFDVAMLLFICKEFKKSCEKITKLNDKTTAFDFNISLFSTN